MLQFGGTGRLRQQASEINYLRESDGAVRDWNRKLMVGNFSGKVHFVMVSLGGEVAGFTATIQVLHP
jgi:hypothetical protein